MGESGTTVWQPCDVHGALTGWGYIYTKAQVQKQTRIKKRKKERKSEDTKAHVQKQTRIKEKKKGKKKTQRTQLT